MREQWSTFRKDGSKRMVVPFEKDERKEKPLFNVKNVPHGYRWFKNDRLMASESFNRFNDQGLKEGPWKVFHPLDACLRLDSMWMVWPMGCFEVLRCKGQFGSCESSGLEEVVQEESREPVIELQELEGEDGTLSETVTYVDGMKQGVARRFDNQGEVVGGSVFANDALVAEGITLKMVLERVQWKDYWPSGSLEIRRQVRERPARGYGCSTGNLGKKSRREVMGPERFTVDGRGGIQVGTFTDRRNTMWASWTASLELDTAGEAIVSGQYVDGERDGVWRLKVNDHLEKVGMC